MAHKRKGFTLIELLLVVSLIGIAAAIAVANIRDSQVTAQVASANRSLKGVVHAARMRAQGQRKFVRISASSAGNGSVTVQDCQLAVGVTDPSGCTWTTITSLGATYGTGDFSRVRVTSVSGGPVILGPNALAGTGSAALTVNFEGRGRPLRANVIINTNGVTSGTTI